MWLGRSDSNTRMTESEDIGYSVKPSKNAVFKAKTAQKRRIFYRYPLVQNNNPPIPPLCPSAIKEGNDACWLLCIIGKLNDILLARQLKS